MKYTLASKYNLMGLAIWNVDSLDYSGTTEGNKDTAEMWTALDIFFKELPKQ